jgi:hypothetical protein
LLESQEMTSPRALVSRDSSLGPFDADVARDESSFVLPLDSTGTSSLLRTLYYPDRDCLQSSVSSSSSYQSHVCFVLLLPAIRIQRGF